MTRNLTPHELVISDYILLVRLRYPGKRHVRINENMHLGIQVLCEDYYLLFLSF